MNPSIARFLFLGVCIVLAVLVLFKLVKVLVIGLLFAAALILLGVISRGFRKSG